MAIICPKCKHQYDVTLFEFDNVVECDCGARIKLDPVRGIILETESVQNRGRLTMTASFIPGFEAADRIKNFIHKDTQTEENKVYLTVKQIYSLDKKGSLDFGGSELNPAERKPLLPKKRLPKDKYGWWDLNQGTYLVEFNEQIELREKEIAILESREELLQNGCFHPLRIITPEEKLSFIPLNVGYQGIDIKQNARISTLRIVKR